MLMKRLYYTALTYAVTGLLSGIVYRELTRHNDVATQLSTTHTHLLALGMLFFLVVLVIAKAWPTITSYKSFNMFFWHYNAGLVLAVAMMFINGIGQLEGNEPSAMMAGISGIGHMLIAAGIGMFFVALHRALGLGDKK